MVEYSIAEYLADTLGMTLGTDVFANALPENVEYGIWVRNLDETYELGALIETVIGIFISYSDYYTTREKAVQVKDAITAMKGYGEKRWCCGGTTRISNLGVNEKGDSLISVTSTINNGGQ